MPSKAQYIAAHPIMERIEAVMDSGGTIQAVDAVRIMPHAQPTWHETQSFATAARRLGLEQDADGAWYADDATHEETTMTHNQEHERDLRSAGLDEYRHLFGDCRRLANWGPGYRKHGWCGDPRCAASKDGGDPT